MRRVAARSRSIIAVAGLVACLGSGGIAQAQGTTARILYPCTTPAFSHLKITSQTSQQGICGYMFAVTAGNKFKLTPVGSADLDIYFYEPDSGGLPGNLKGQNTGGLTNCGELPTPAEAPYTVPQGSTLAVVVLSPTPICSNVMNVSFTYSTY